MGKLTVADAEKLVKDGLLDNKTVEQMQDDGLISKGRRASKRWMKTSEGTWVSPQLYFQGVGKSKYTKKMDEFKTEFNSLLEKYATNRTNTPKTK